MTKKNSESKNGGAPYVPASAKGKPSKTPVESSRKRKGQSEADKEIRPRDGHYLIMARRRGNLLPSFATNLTFDALKDMESQGVHVRKRISPKAVVAQSAFENSGDVLVLSAPIEKGLELKRTAHADLIVEANHPLVHFAMPQAVQDPAPASAPSTGENVQLTIVDGTGRPVANTAVTMWGTGLPQQGQTDAQGKVTMAMYSPVAALYIKPFADFWERWITRPALNPNGINKVTLQKLESFPDAGFPGQGRPFVGWGQKLMRLDVPVQPTGKGVKIAIIDSGCDRTHPALTHIDPKNGTDFTADNNPFLDRMGHGTHCAGVIAGNGTKGIRGFVPEAEVHVLKLFPGGRFDSLIDAVRYCIEHEIDIVNCSLGADQSSEVVQTWIDDARQAGVALFVAAGNSSSTVQFPARLPSVMAVAAIGQDARFPSNTYHAQTVGPTGISTDGVFSAKFTCFGPEVRVCAPGVAVISTMPGHGYAAEDGTSMAAPHITGIAAMLLASDNELLAQPRGPARVDRLFQKVMAAALQLNLPPALEGVGLPQLGKPGKVAAAHAISYGAPAGNDLVQIITSAVARQILSALNSSYAA